ncbi:hypothetical protein CYY_003369 [Polysphondylium violaceum]|uniref:Uncharacterized protein n=1 Tax=Polysphondylium violaceum TaxID=133409 RepID=A0A8J4PWV8_9MYCE|nr:hypothetical protein CYY_003369 [Polysphondylium violaceum]
MVFPKKEILNHPSHIPKVFGELKIRGNLADHIRKYKTLNSSTIPSPRVPVCNGVAALNTHQTQAIVFKTPLLSMEKITENSFKNANFKNIKGIKQTLDSDIKPLYDSICKLGDKAWVVVEDQRGEQYCMVFSESGFIYTKCTAMSPYFGVKSSDINAKYHAYVEFGFHSSNLNFGGCHSYDLGLTQIFPHISAAMMIAKTLNYFLVGGIGFDANEFASRLTLAASDLGLGFLSFYTPKWALTGHVECLTFALVFIANSLYDPAYGRTLVQVFNWDTNNDWKLKTQTLLNTKSPGFEQGTSSVDTKLTKQPTRDIVTTTFPYDSVKCYYSALVYQVDSLTTPSSFALRVTLDNDITQGFTYAYSRPPQNQGKAGQIIQGRPLDPQEFLSCSIGKFQSSPLNTLITTNHQTPVSASMDIVESQLTNLFNVIININNKSVQSFY